MIGSNQNAFKFKVADAKMAKPARKMIGEARKEMKTAKKEIKKYTDF